MVFISVVSLDLLFSFYQNQKYAWIEVSIYTLNLVLDQTSFLNTSVQYDESHFTDTSSLMKVPLFALKKNNSSSIYA